MYFFNIFGNFVLFVPFTFLLIVPDSRLENLKMQFFVVLLDVFNLIATYISRIFIFIPFFNILLCALFRVFFFFSVYNKTAIRHHINDFRLELDLGN